MNKLHTHWNSRLRDYARSSIYVTSHQTNKKKKKNVYMLLPASSPINSCLQNNKKGKVGLMDVFKKKINELFLKSSNFIFMKSIESLKKTQLLFCLIKNFRKYFIN